MRIRNNNVCLHAAFMSVYQNCHEIVR